jgi:predicted enzyme related to lactoylglutathione lyase
LTRACEGLLKPGIPALIPRQDLDAEVAVLVERGVPVLEGIQEAPWGRYAVFADPDGNRLVLRGRPTRV